MPRNVEDLRAKYTVMKHLWLLAQMRQPGRHAFSDLGKDTWTDLLEELLNKDNFLFERQIEGGGTLVGPDWNACLECEFQIRKQACVLVREEGYGIQQALWAAYEDPQHRMKNWIQPLTVANAKQESSADKIEKLQKRILELERSKQKAQKLMRYSDSAQQSSSNSSHWRGQVRPMEVGSGYTARELCDGQTLASPGRWEPSLRRYPTHSAWESVAGHLREYTHRAGTPELLLRLAVGKVAVSPFPEEEVKQLRTQVVDELISQGYGPRRTATDRDNVPIDFRLLQSLLDAAGDPEVSVGDFASGVRVGPGARLPRFPALYRRKRNCRLPEQASPEDYLEDCEDGASAWRQNYKSLEPLENEVLAVLEDQFSRGQVLKFTEQEAKAEYPKLVVASLGAQKKDKPGGVVTARVLFDGTNGVQVNKRTRIRDQERAPIAADIKRLMRQKAAVGERTFALTADVAEAHRQVPVDPRDWYLLGSQVVPGGDVYINTVGTFGVASASYYWSRVASSVGRLTQYCTGSRATTWHLLVADDYHLEAGGAEYRSALLVFFVLCAVVGVPLSWSKTAGGDVVSWVGFELLHRSHQLGISEKRAA